MRITPLHLAAAGFSELDSILRQRFVVVCTRGRECAAIRRRWNDLTGESALLTIAEVAVAFAGFASVVTVFRRRDPVGWAPQDALRFQLMISSSLSVVFFALLPFAISFFGATEVDAWSFSSGLLALYLALSLGLVARRAVLLTTGEALNSYISWIFGAGALIVLILQLLNAAGMFFERELGPYFVGLLFMLVLAGVSFARMLPLSLGSQGR